MIERISNDILLNNTDITTALIEYFKFICIVGDVCNNSCWIEGEDDSCAVIIHETTRIMKDRIHPNFEDIMNYFLKALNSEMGYLSHSGYSTIGYVEYSDCVVPKFPEILRKVTSTDVDISAINHVVSDIKSHYDDPDSGNLNTVLTSFKKALDTISEGLDYPEEIEDYIRHCDYGFSSDDIYKLQCRLGVK